MNLLKRFLKGRFNGSIHLEEGANTISVTQSSMDDEPIVLVAHPVDPTFEKLCIDRKEDRRG